MSVTTDTAPDIDPAIAAAKRALARATDAARKAGAKERVAWNGVVKARGTTKKQEAFAWKSWCEATNADIVATEALERAKVAAYAAGVA